MNQSTVLIIDGGGRGSVLVDKYSQSSHVIKILAIPGNDLMLTNQKPVKIFPKIKTTDIKSIIKIAKDQKVDLVDVAQDDAVASGLVDALQKEGINVFGPTKLAGQIEWDKAFARNFMRKFKITIPTFKICHSQKEGINFIKKQKHAEWFIKASGLAAGKGALHAQNNRQAIEKIRQMKDFGKAGQTYLIEKCLVGEEFSSFAIVDGKNFIIVGYAQDHKPVFDGDLGSNTGGMGCSSPPMAITPEVENQIESIFKKTVEGLVKIGRPYQGILYLGEMIDQRSGLPAGRQVYAIEFNARWGDPEAQVIVPAIKNDFYELANKVLNGQIKKIKIKKDNLYRVAVTAASRGYPSDYSKVIGKQIFGLDQLLRNPVSSLRHPEPFACRSEQSEESQDKLREGSIKVFGAGVKKKNNQYFVSGGRLFYVVAEGKNVAQARKIAYNALSRVNVEGDNLHYRTDIGWRDLERFYERG